MNARDGALRVAVDARPLDIDFLRTQGIGRVADGVLRALAPEAARRRGELLLMRSGAEGGSAYGSTPGAGVERTRQLTLRRPPVPQRFADLPEQVLMPLDLRRSRAHVYHALSIYRLAFAPGIPSVLTVYDVIPLMWPERYLRTGIVHRLLYAAARRADWLIAISEAARRDVIEHLHVDPERVEVILLAADERYRPVDPAPVLAGLGLSSPYLLYVGGLANDDPRKGVRELIDGYAAWWRSNERPESLVLAGRLGPAGEPLVEHARRSGAPIHFTGFVPEEAMPGLYCGASCLVTASRYEGFGLPALEAVACGTPVVGFDVGALPEAAGPGGLLVPDGRMGALIEAVESLCDDPRVRARLSAEGRRHAAGFSWVKNAEKTWDVYERAAGRR